MNQESDGHTSGGGLATFDFDGARVLVTGGSNGIGLGVASAFADSGAKVMITGRRESADDYEHSDQLARFEYRSLEVRSSEEIDALTTSLEHLDVLVNNAGGTFPDGLDESDPNGFEAAIELNLFGAHRLSRRCFDLLEASSLPGGGSVVNVVSMSAFRPSPMVPGYGAAKAALIHLTRQLGLAWATEGVRVNAVGPGLIETNLTSPMKGIEDIEAPELAKVAMQRWGYPEDVVGAFLFLSSASAAFITGQTLCVDGGYSLT